jgi:hypothetical protein
MAVGSEIRRAIRGRPRKAGKTGVVAVAIRAEAVKRTITVGTPLGAAAGAVDTAVGSEIRKATRRLRSEVGGTAD